MSHALARHGVGPLIRGPRASDKNYVASTWVRSMSGCASRALGTRGGEVGRQVDIVMDRDDSRVLIRHAPGDMDRILGWVVHCEGPGIPLVHYVYVRDKERGKGIASSLLHSIGASKGAALVYTNRGPDTRLMMAAYPLAQYLSLKEFLA